jgi:hypothetical protein
MHENELDKSEAEAMNYHPLAFSTIEFEQLVDKQEQEIYDLIAEVEALKARIKIIEERK